MDLKHPTAFDDAAVAELFHRVDKDGSGTVDFQEFIDLVYVELQERIGLDHAVYGVPVYKLRRRPETFRAPANVFALGADPFRQLLGLEAAGRRRRARAHTTRRIEALSRPMGVATRAAPPKRRDVLSSRTDGRRQLTRNIFDPQFHDKHSVPRKEHPPPEKPPVALYFHRNYRYAGPRELPADLISPLDFPLDTTSLHRHAYGHSRARKAPFPRRSTSSADAAAPSSLAAPTNSNVDPR